MNGRFEGGNIMSDLYDSVTCFLERDPVVQAIKNGLGIPSDEAAKSAIGLSIPTMIGNLAGWVEGSMGSTWLAARLPAVGPQSLEDFEALNRAPDFRRFGSSVIDIILGNQRPSVIHQISRRAFVTEHAADTILAGTAWVVMARLSEQHRPHPERDNLIEQLTAEQNSLVSAGWGSWLDATVVAVADNVTPAPQRTAERFSFADPGTPSWARAAVYPSQTTTTDTLAPPSPPKLVPLSATSADRQAVNRLSGGVWAAPEAAAPAGGLAAGGVVEPGSTPGADSPDRPGSFHNYQSRSALTTQPNLYGDSVHHRRNTESTKDAAGLGVLGSSGLSMLPPSEGQGADDESNRAFKLLPWIVGVVTLALLAGGVFLWTRRTSDESAAVTNSIDSTDSTDSTDTATTSDSASSSEGGEDESALELLAGETDLMPSDSRYSVNEVLSMAAEWGATVEGDVATLAPSITNPLGKISASSASMVALNPKTGEVCYQFDIDGLGSPYDGHIHVGPAGVKGGIVADFGSLDGPTNACLAMEPVDVRAILADMPGHYVELHDADEENTIRRQLADLDPNDPAVAVDIPVDPETGGAVIVVEQGKLILRGNVPDHVTVDKFLATFGDIDFGNIEVVNELVVVEGAPRPSGRIIVDDSIVFAHNSDQITNPDATVLSDLAALFKARPAWMMTVVGHTDSKGSDVYNLGLSLRRAAAVRDLLIERGVPRQSLAIEGAGDTDPVGDNATTEGRAQNRRIEFRVIAG